MVELAVSGDVRELSLLPTDPDLRGVPPPRGDRDPSRGRSRGENLVPSDRISISPQATEAFTFDQFEPGAIEGERDASGSTVKEALTPAEQEEVAKLRARDREVRAHEAAHAAAAGNLAQGGPSFSFETGPDGGRYAVGGEVSISLSKGDTPEETIRIANQARRAALAPANPSPQDRAVASKAAQMAATARRELNASEPSEPSPEGSSVAPIGGDHDHSDGDRYLLSTAARAYASTVGAPRTPPGSRLAIVA